MKKNYQQPESTAFEMSLNLLQDTVSGETGGSGVKPGEGDPEDYAREWRNPRQDWDDEESDQEDDEW